MLALDDQERSLTTRESELLALLCEYQGRVLERSVEIRTVHGKGFRLS